MVNIDMSKEEAVRMDHQSTHLELHVHEHRGSNRGHIERVRDHKIW
jgi:hypothetical protein